MHASVIGGAGLLGSAIAAELMRLGLFERIALLDAQAELAAAEIRDLREASIGSGVELSSATQINFATQSDLFIFAGGFASQSNEPRFELARRYLRHFCWHLKELKNGGLKRDAIVLIAAEPSELLTEIAARYLDLPSSRVIGMGTVVDRRRLQVGLADALSKPVGEIAIEAIGVRGAGMVPLWSGAIISGEPISKLRPWEGAWQHTVEMRARTADTDQLRGKGGAYRAPAAAVGEVAQAILRNEGRPLPVCISHDFKSPRYGLRRATLALPTLVGRSGAGEVVEQKLWPKEMTALHQAARRVQRDIQALAKLA